MRCGACFLFAALAFVPAAEALAQPQDEIAKDEFRLGREAFKQGNYKEALPRFRRSQQILPQVGTLLNLASCEEKLGMVASARQHFQQAVSQLSDRDDRVAFAKERIAALEPRVSRLRIKLGPASVGARHIELDDAPVADAAIDTDLPLDPGSHVVVVKTSGRRDRRYDVALKEGESASVTVESGESGAPLGVARGGEVSGKRIAGFVVGGAGIVGIAVGAITGAMALATKSDLEKLCPVPASCTQDGVDKASKGKTLSVVSTVGFIAGVAGAGAGVFLVLTGGEPKAAATVSVSALPGGGAVGVGGRF